MGEFTGSTERVYGPPSHTAPTPTLHPTTKAFSLFIRMIMGQKPERAPCLSTISCGDGFVAMSCVSMGAQCAAMVQQRQSRAEETKKKKRPGNLKDVPEAKVDLAGQEPLDHDLIVTHC